MTSMPGVGIGEPKLGTTDGPVYMSGQAWIGCCWDTSIRLALDLPQHPEWIYVRTWCECGQRVTHWKSASVLDRFINRS